MQESQECSSVWVPPFFVLIRGIHPIYVDDLGVILNSSLASSLMLWVVARCVLPSCKLNGASGEVFVLISRSVFLFLSVIVPNGI